MKTDMSTNIHEVHDYISKVQNIHVVNIYMNY